MTEQDKVKAGAESRAETPDEQFARWLGGLLPADREAAVRRANTAIRVSERASKAPIGSIWACSEGVWFGYKVRGTGLRERSLDRKSTRLNSSHSQLSH